ncbi:MAG: alpha/beta fold hydrolase [Frankia sp.]
MVVPGFSGSSEKPAVRGVAERLRPFGGVLVVDPRGHGRSSGRCTFGDREVLDVDAAVGWMRSAGYERVVTVGWSMGGSSVLRHAAFVGNVAVHGFPISNTVDAVVSVSAPSRWFVRDTAPMRRLHRLAETASGRAVARRLFKVRIDPAGWPAIPASPLEVVGDIAPTPLLLVHGDRDSYFPLEHPIALAAAAGQPGELWIVPGFGHAEAGVTPGLVARIGRHLPDLLAGRREDPAGPADSADPDLVAVGAGDPPAVGDAAGSAEHRGDDGGDGGHSGDGAGGIVRIPRPTGFGHTVTGMRPITVRYWAAAREAAGVAEECVEAVTLADLIATVSTERGPALAAVLAISSFLVDERPVGRREPAAVPLTTATVVEVLPPFAGG